jgi:hypothetical protein
VTRTISITGPAWDRYARRCPRLLAEAPSLLAFEYGYDKGKAVITGTRRHRATRSNLNAKNDAVPPPSIRTRPGRPHSLDAAFASLFWAIAVSVLNEQLVQTFLGFGGH